MTTFRQILDSLSLSHYGLVPTSPSEAPAGTPPVAVPPAPVDPAAYSLPSVCVCGSRLDGREGADLRADHRLCARTASDVLRAPARRTARPRPLATPKDGGKASTVAVGAERRAIDDKGKGWRRARRAALAALASAAPIAAHCFGWEGAAVLLPTHRETLRAEVATMPPALGFLVRLEASRFDIARWKRDDRSFERRAVRDPMGPIASETLSRVWERALVETDGLTALLPLIHNAARWIARGDRRIGGAIGGKIDRMNVDEHKEAARTAAGRTIDAMPHRMRASMAERMADCPTLSAVAVRIDEIQTRGIDRALTQTERNALVVLRETLAKALALT